MPVHARSLLLCALAVAALEKLRRLVMIAKGPKGAKP